MNALHCRLQKSQKPCKNNFLCCQIKLARPGKTIIFFKLYSFNVWVALHINLTFAILCLLHELHVQCMQINEVHVQIVQRTKDIAKVGFT